jgi:hypothetical protein
MEELESCIDGALDQSFFCLYGLNMNPDSTSEEDLVTHQNTSRGDYQTKEQCADVFHYILPYAKTLSVSISVPPPPPFFFLFSLFGGYLIWIKTNFVQTPEYQ